MVGRYRWCKHAVWTAVACQVYVRRGMEVRTQVAVNKSVTTEQGQVGSVMLSRVPSEKFPCGGHGVHYGVAQTSSPALEASGPLPHH